MLKLPTLTTGFTTEHYVLVLLTVGMPLIGFVWFGWRAALTAFVLTQVVIGLTKLRYS